ncbi:hypothetical protein 015DV002_42 [Bacillus phage 015DV002]|nr:hypothetical protein 015DV002_42 [Bacillus phage 015DV002]QQO41272.1 hypothetical protein 015DV004_56 [Bacillus phage 015DV004]
MDVIVTTEEAKMLEYYFDVMKDSTRTIGERRVAKLHYDSIYREAKLRSKDKYKQMRLGE